MAANTNPIFEIKPVIGTTALAAANTARDGSGTIVTIVTGAADGTRIDEIRFISSQATAAASTARVGRVFLSVDSGTTWTLFDEVAIATATASNTAVGDKNVLSYPLGIMLKDSTQKIGVAMSVYAGVQDRTAVIARGGDYS